METVIALDIGGTKIAGALVTYESREEPPTVSNRRSVPTDALRGGEAVLESACSLAIELARDCSGTLRGIGVGAAGIVDPASGSIRYANDLMPGWGGIPLRDSLSKSLELPAAALGDVQAHALGEARWGVARRTRSSLCVGAGTGIGGAFVIDGHVVRGWHGAAGHIGHTLHPAADGMSCACGGSSHVESVASGTAIAMLYQSKASPDELDPALMGDVVAKRADAGDLEALAAIELAGRALGEAIGSWCNILDPELVVLSGSVTGAGPLWRRALDDGFKAQILEPLRDTPLLFAALGGDAPLVGVAEHLLDECETKGAEEVPPF